MREIKFRAKDILQGNWHYGSYLYTDNNVNNPYLTTPPVGKHQIFEYRAGDFLMGGWEGIEVSPETIGQFTGLYDKNRKEIYEGDIIRSFDSEGNSILHHVEYTGASFVAILKDSFSFDRSVITQDWLKEFDKVVIGNIHDDKEYLI